MRTEDQIRDEAKIILGFDDGEENVQQGTGQLTTFNQLGFSGKSDKPDGWYLPSDKGEVAIVLEAKSEKEDLTKAKWVKELKKNISITYEKYSKVVGILYNGSDIRVFKNEEEITGVASTLQHKQYYKRLYSQQKIDKQHIYRLTKQINDTLHTLFGINDLKHRMIFTACALVAKRYGAVLDKNMSFSLMKASILDTLSQNLAEDKRLNAKLEILTDVYRQIQMNSTENQKAISDFITWVSEISECVNSDYWNGEDVMGIFFNEFNRYKKKSESGQVFTPDHITSFMYRLIEINKDDRVLDAACGSGAFLVKAMCNMIKSAGGVNSKEAGKIKKAQLFGIEWDKQIYALACANMLIHKDGKTNLEQLDSRTDVASSWIKSKGITKVLMNPPFEKKYGCLDIVKNVLDSVAYNPDNPSVSRQIMCAFIMPDKKLEKDSQIKVKKILKAHSLQKIIKLPEKVFFEGVTTSIFVFKTGVPQNNKDIFACYIEDDGLETVKNQGRQDIKNRWQSIEDKWVEIIGKQSGSNTIQWFKPSEHLSYQMPQRALNILEEDFSKTITDYLLFEEKTDVRLFSENLIKKILYSSSIASGGDNMEINIKIKSED